MCDDLARPDSCHPAYAWQNDALAQYVYDAAGNRGPADTGNRLTAFDGYSFEHDADGNLTRKLKHGVDDVQPFWNSLGQMIGAWRHQRGTVWYGYNGFGRRVRRTAPDGTVTRYLYDGDDLFMEVDDAGNPKREYTYYPGVDQPHSVRIAGQTYYYATDAVGHVTGLLNGSGQVVNRYSYTPWGEVVSAQETVSQPLGYMARENDTVTGLYYVRARWYDAHQGRFVSEDPIGLAGGLNVYAYVGNSPTNFTDPSGLCYYGESGRGGSAIFTFNGVTTDSGACPPLPPNDRGASWPRGGVDAAVVDPGGAGAGLGSLPQVANLLVPPPPPPPRTLV